MNAVTSLSNWLEKYKKKECPSGQHRHPGAMYCHPIKQKHHFENNPKSVEYHKKIHGAAPVDKGQIGTLIDNFHNGVINYSEMKKEVSKLFSSPGDDLHEVWQRLMSESQKSLGKPAGEMKWSDVAKFLENKLSSMHGKPDDAKKQAKDKIDELIYEGKGQGITAKYKDMVAYLFPGYSATYLMVEAKKVGKGDSWDDFSEFLKDKIDAQVTVAEPKKEKKEIWQDILQPTSGQLGSTDGGVYEHKNTGKKFYVKFPGKERAEVENLAANLYALAGVHVVNTEIIELNDRPAIKSDWLEGTSSMSMDEMAKHDLVTKNFAIDAWLANWDVVGLASDNIVMGKDGIAYRIDPGGSLYYRAQGETKDFGNDVPELETMRDANKNPQAAKVFKNISKEHLDYGATKLSLITDDKIDNIVNATGLDSNTKSALKGSLKSRRDYIVNKLIPPKGKVGRPAKECSPGFHKHDGYGYCHPVNQKHRGMQDFGKTISVEKQIAKHPNRKIQEIYEKCKNVDIGEVKAYSMNSVEQIAKSVGLDIQEGKILLHGWQGGGAEQQIPVRSALLELKNKWKQNYPIENAYFLYEKDVRPSHFKLSSRKGLDNVENMIPFVLASQKYLKSQYPSGRVTVYRGIDYKKLVKKYKEMNDTDTVAMPNDGISGWTLKKGGVGFGDILFKKEVPIESIWIAFNAFTENFKEEEEVLVDSDVVLTFKKDEITVEED